MSKILDKGDKLQIVVDGKNNFFVSKSGATVEGESNQIVISLNDTEVFRDECGNISDPTPQLLENKTEIIQGYIDSVANQFQDKLANFSTELGIDYKVNASAGAITVTLTEIVEGQEHHIGKIDAVANSVTLTPENGLINGAATFVLISQYDFAHVKFDGVNWFVV